jgi:hypothetical protein
MFSPPVLEAILPCMQPATIIVETPDINAFFYVIFPKIPDPFMGGQIKCADVGSAKNCKEDGVVRHCALNKCFILTPAQKRGLKNAGTYSVPAIILHVPAAGRGLAEHIHIVEITYCKALVSCWWPARMP